MTSLKVHETSKRTCPHCNSTHVEKEKETLVCMECGTVIEETTVSSEKEPFYSYEDAVNKGQHSYTSHGPPKTRTERRNLQLAISMFDTLVNKLHLPHFIRGDAIKRFKQLLHEKQVRKDTVPGIAAALIYLVCRKSHIPLPLKQLAEQSEAEQTDIVKQYKDILHTLKINVQPVSIEALTLRFAKKARLSPQTIGVAKEIGRKLDNNAALIGRDPKGIAAAAVYLAAQRREEALTQDKIAEIASITTITLRNQLEVLPALPV